MKPFVPEFVPAIGEVDALIKMPRNDGQAEAFGITVLDEPCLNPEDKTVLELKYMQSVLNVKHVPLTQPETPLPSLQAAVFLP